MGGSFPVCGYRRKHSLLDYFSDSGKKSKSGLRARLEALENLFFVYSSFLCALFWPVGHCLCGKRPDESVVGYFVKSGNSALYH